MVERTCSEMGGKRCSGLQARLESEGSLGTLHHDPGRCGPPLCPYWRCCGRTLSRALRAYREPNSKPAAPESIEQSRGEEAENAARQIRHRGGGLQHYL